MATYRIQLQRPRHIIILRNLLGIPIVHTSEEDVVEIDTEIEPGTRFGPVVVLEKL